MTKKLWSGQASLRRSGSGGRRKNKNKKSKHKMKKSNSSPSRLHQQNASLSDEEGDVEGTAAGIHSLSIQLLDLMHTLHTRG
jgi:brefeldin A-resistance guanine nucleotide exchange factor 1